MTDEEERQYVEETKEWYQRWPWRQVVTTVVAAALIGSATWGLGLVSRVESTANAVEKVPENAQDIDRLERELQALRSGQQQILDRLSELREDMREEQ